MPALVPPIADEREILLAFLAQQRYALRLAATGLTDEQASTKSTVSALTVGGLIKHITLVERNWMAGIVARRPLPPPDWGTVFTIVGDETLAGWLGAYAQAAAETEAIVRERGMDDPVPVPRDQPWFPKDVEAWSVRWVLLHMIEETARHAGHADIIREGLDGASAMPLLAQAEGWAEQLQQWMEGFGE